jgi:internalin A
MPRRKPLKQGRVPDISNLTDLPEEPKSEAPSQIWTGQEVEYIYASSMQLSTLALEVEKLPNLRKLVLSSNNLKALPPEIGSLTNLEYLDASLNQLRQLPPQIGDLAHLESLYLDRNQLTGLPQEIRKLANLRYLDLRENPLSIPPEILDKRDDPQAIFDFYFSARSRTLSEVKLLVVGQGSVGKTSLIRTLLGGKFDPGETKTEGISINRWQIDAPSNIQLNIWDFGGQEIMHATHQFFLTKRSLYLLVLDSRLTQEENRVEYWLKIIQSFGGDSPILIVGNKMDQHPLDIDRTGLRKKYPGIVKILEASAATGANIKELKASIIAQVNRLPHVQDLVPEVWFKVKSELETLGRSANFITHDQYLAICTENGVHDEISQRILIGFLHDLGVILHFQDDPRLEALGILNPEWVTSGVYRILNSRALFENRGVLTLALLDEILNLPDYPRGKRLFIVDMMRKFELCYGIESGKTFLIPDLLPKDEPPTLKFKGIQVFEYAYPVLPSSIITRFIVRMNEKIHEGGIWRTGVLLKIAENTALVKADLEDRKITIAIDGEELTRRDTLSAIRYQLDEIHASIKGLDPQKRVPVPGAPNAEPIDYDYLLQLEKNDFDELPVKDGNRLVNISVRRMLSGIQNIPRRRRQNQRDTNIQIGNINIGEHAVVGDIVVAAQIERSLNRASTANIDVELKATLRQLAEAVQNMSRALPAEKAAEVADDYARLIDEATKPEPNRKWYSVSIEGLIKAAENLDKLGEPVISLSKKVLSLLTLGAVK